MIVAGCSFWVDLRCIYRLLQLGYLQFVAVYFLLQTGCIIIVLVVGSICFVKKIGVLSFQFTKILFKRCIVFAVSANLLLIFFYQRLVIGVGTTYQPIRRLGISFFSGHHGLKTTAFHVG